EESNLDRALDSASAPDHFLDMELVPEAAMKAVNRYDFVAEMIKAGQKPATAGFVPYQMLELFQRLRIEFRLWRAEKDANRRRWITVGGCQTARHRKAARGIVELPEGVKQTGRTALHPGQERAVQRDQQFARTQKVCQRAVGRGRADVARFVVDGLGDQRTRLFADTFAAVTLMENLVYEFTCTDAPVQAVGIF